MSGTNSGSGGSGSGSGSPNLTGTQPIQKRRLISLLPAVNQTKALKNFFGVTVDELFQPGTSTAVNGYIGQIPEIYNKIWVPNSYYSVGDYVVYNELLYQCIVAHTSTLFFNPVNWAVSDFYLEEPDEERQNYQLEPGMVSTNTADLITNALTYPDLINYLSNNNGIVSNQQRLFETDYYSWSPPIDIDKFVNYNQYYWFGETTQIPTLVLASPILQYVGDGSTTSFEFPNSIVGISTNQETPAIYVDGISQTYSLSNGSAILSNAPGIGSQIITTLFDNLYEAIIGQTTFPISSFLSFAESFTADGYTSTFSEIQQTWTPGINYVIGNFVVYNGINYICITNNLSGTTFNPAYWQAQEQKIFSYADEFAVYYTAANSTNSVLLSNSNFSLLGTQVTINSIPGSSLTVPAYDDTITAVSLNGLFDLLNLSASLIPFGLSYDLTLTSLSSGMCIQLLDTQSFFQGWDDNAWDSSPWDAGASNYYVDGVGQSIRLTASTDIITGLSPQYVTIDRSSLDGNPWSIRNSWVHEATFSWSGKSYSGLQAVRPIIEFVKDIVLFNYGYTRYPFTVSGVLTNNATLIVNGTSTSITADQIQSCAVGDRICRSIIECFECVITNIIDTRNIVVDSWFESANLLR